MSVQSEIDRIITAVGNAYSKVSEKGGTVPASQTVANLATAIDSIPAGGAKETWVIKSNASGEFATTQIAFTSNGQKFTSIGTNNDSGTFVILHYDNNEVAGYDPGAGSYGYEFDNEAYRKLTFDTSPAGALLTWLQSNATKQPDDTAVQDTKALTITSNGTVSVTPDAPYDGLSSVDVTVNVSGGGSIGEILSGEVIPTKETPPSELFVTLPNGEQMTVNDLWSSSVDKLWNKVVLNGDAVSFLIINTTDSHVSTSIQIKQINIDFYKMQGKKRRVWRRCLSDASYNSIADTLCFKTGSKYVYYWI